jgi:hypothetical protein
MELMDGLPTAALVPRRQKLMKRGLTSESLLRGGETGYKRNAKIRDGGGLSESVHTHTHKHEGGGFTTMS